MKIILSPSKTLNLNTPLPEAGKDLFNEKKSLHIMKILEGMNKEETGEAFKIKGKLLDETFDIYHNRNKLRFDPIGCYDGVVYEKLCKRNYDHVRRDYLEDHLVIISAMFGIVEPGMGIWPYRLDFKTKPKGLNLYKYWEEEILEYFKDEDVIINLASNEFSSILKPMSHKLININFLESDGRVLSFHAKKARGAMADMLVDLLAEDIEGIKEICVNDYQYNKDRSDDKNYYYIKKEVL